MKNKKSKKSKKGLVFIIKADETHKQYPDKRGMKYIRKFLKEITPKGYSVLISPFNLELKGEIEIK